MQLRRNTVVAAVRLVQPLVKASNARGFASCPLRVHNSGTSPKASASCPAVQKLLPRAPCRQVTSTTTTQQRQVAEVDDRGQVSDEPPARNAINNHELHEKWGWKTSDPLYWPCKIMGVFSTKNTNALSSARMLQTCLNNAECTEWYSDGKISNEFLPKLLWLSTNVWLMSRRLLREGERGKKVQELLFDELWRETKRQMRSIEVSEMMLKKYLAEAQQHTFITLVQYDHAYTLESREERMDVLTSALWRGVYMSDESIKEPHVRVLAEYVDAELADIYAVDVWEFFAVCIEFAPPPTAELKAASKKAAKGGRGKRSSRKGIVAAAPGLEGDAADSTTGGRSGGIGEKVLHGDFGSGGGREGRWRACLAESGKVYYWHTVSREVTWDRPPGAEAYVPSVMPKTDQTLTAAA